MQYLPKVTAPVPRQTWGDFGGLRLLNVFDFMCRSHLFYAKTIWSIINCTVILHLVDILGNIFQWQFNRPQIHFET